MFDLILLFILILIYIYAINKKNLLHSVIFLSGGSMILSILFFILKAPDVAITEATVTAITIVIFIFAFKKIKNIE